MAPASNSKVNYVLVNVSDFVCYKLFSINDIWKIEAGYVSTSKILLCPIEIVKISNVQCPPVIKCWNYCKLCFSLKNKSNVSEVYRKKLYFKCHGQNIILKFYTTCVYSIGRVWKSWIDGSTWTSRWLII